MCRRSSSAACAAAFACEDDLDRRVNCCSTHIIKTECRRNDFGGLQQALPPNFFVVFDIKMKTLLRNVMDGVRTLLEALDISM